MPFLRNVKYNINILFNFKGPYVDGNRHGKGELVKSDTEVRHCLTSDR